MKNIGKSLERSMAEELVSGSNIIHEVHRGPLVHSILTTDEMKIPQKTSLYYTSFSTSIATKLCEEIETLAREGNMKLGIEITPYEDYRGNSSSILGISLEKEDRVVNILMHPGDAEEALEYQAIATRYCDKTAPQQRGKVKQLI